MPYIFAAKRMVNCLNNSPLFILPLAKRFVKGRLENKACWIFFRVFMRQRGVCAMTLMLFLWVLDMCKGIDMTHVIAGFLRGGWQCWCNEACLFVKTWWHSEEDEIAFPSFEIHGAMSFRSMNWVVAWTGAFMYIILKYNMGFFQ